MANMSLVIDESINKTVAHAQNLSDRTVRLIREVTDNVVDSVQEA